MFDYDAPSVPPGWEPSDSIVADLDDAHLETCRQQRRLLSLIAEADRRDAWLDSGARDMAHWVSIRYGVSWWKARPGSSRDTRWSGSHSCRRRSPAAD